MSHTRVPKASRYFAGLATTFTLGMVFSTPAFAQSSSSQQVIQGQQIANWSDVFTSSDPGSLGWELLWNGSGAITQPELFDPLLPTSHPIYKYDADGIPGVSLTYNQLGSSVNFADYGNGVYGGHPDWGADNSVTQRDERFAIAKYTLTEDLDFDLVIQDFKWSALDITGGMLFEIYTQTEELGYVKEHAYRLFGDVPETPEIESIYTFDNFAPRGKVNSIGESIYLAFGANGDATNDTFALEFGLGEADQIVLSPQPPGNGGGGGGNGGGGNGGGGNGGGGNGGGNGGGSVSVPEPGVATGFGLLAMVGLSRLRRRSEDD